MIINLNNAVQLTGINSFVKFSSRYKINIKKSDSLSDLKPGMADNVGLGIFAPEKKVFRNPQTVESILFRNILSF